MRTWKSAMLTAMVCGTLAVIAIGCATMADARRARGTGPSRTYNVPAEEIWQAMPSILSEVGLEYVGENREEGYILAQRGITGFSYGENVAIFVESLGQNKTKVEIVSKKALATTIFAPEWSGAIFRELDERF